jgi:hypothetical protein
MLASSHSGSPRSARGSVEIQAVGGRRLSYPLARWEPLGGGRWLTYSVILREDFGWINEPDGKPATFDELYTALQAPTALLIRGDQWVYSGDGHGAEIVYLNNVTLVSSREI